jgi:hypothetical protein
LQVKSSKSVEAFRGHSTLGTTTAVHGTVSESRSAWGLLTSTTRGEQRHERPLWYPDEVARMDEESCLLLTKAHPPVLARKLDAPLPPVLSLPQRYTRPALAASVVLALMLSGWTVGQFRPSPPVSHTGASTPGVPPLAMTTETPRQADDAPDTIVSWLERQAIREPRPWRLHKKIDPNPLGKGVRMAPEPWHGPYPSQQACEAEKARLLKTLYLFVERQPPGQVHQAKIPDGVLYKGKIDRRETYHCLRHEEDPT